MKSLAGRFLVASPQLSDGNFYRAVVLMLQHDEEGAFGLILNRPTDITLQEIWDQIGEATCDSPRPIHLGGPVPGPLMSIHAKKSCSETEILPGVYFATDKELINEIVRDEETPFYIFSGYSGWGGGQLEIELEVGGWLSMPAVFDTIFSDPHDMWKRVTTEIGRDIMFPHGKCKHMVDDPSVN